MRAITAPASSPAAGAEPALDRQVQHADGRHAHQRLGHEQAPGVEPEQPHRQAHHPQRGRRLVDGDEVGRSRWSRRTAPSSSATPLGRRPSRTSWPTRTRRGPTGTARRWPPAGRGRRAAPTGRRPGRAAATTSGAGRSAGPVVRPAVRTAWPTAARRVRRRAAAARSRSWARASTPGLRPRWERPGRSPGACRSPLCVTAYVVDDGGGGTAAGVPPARSLVTRGPATCTRTPRCPRRRPAPRRHGRGRR